MRLSDIPRTQHEQIPQLGENGPVSSVADSLAAFIARQIQDFADIAGHGVHVQGLPRLEQLELDAASIGGLSGPVDERVRVVTRCWPEVHRADTLGGGHVHRSRVVVDPYVPADTRRIEGRILPSGMILGLVMYPLHFVEKWDHREVCVDSLARAGVSGPAVGGRLESVRPLVGVNDVEQCRLAHDPVRIPQHHFSKQLGPLSYLFRSAIPDLLVGGERHVERIPKVGVTDILDGSQHGPDRTLHVAAAAAVQPASLDSGLEWSVVARKPGVGRHHIGVAKIGHASGSAALLADNVDLVNSLRIDVLDSFRCKSKLLQNLF